MNAFLLDYAPTLILLVLATGLGIVFLLGAKVLAPHDPDFEKVSAYESGFNPFSDSRMKFNVRFYLIAILFIIFDIEIAFLFPAAVALDEFNTYAWAVVMIFLFELAVGYVYALKKGALDFE